LLPYRCPGCDRRFLGFRGSAASNGPLDPVPDRPASPAPAVRHFFLFRKSRGASYAPAENAPRKPVTTEYGHPGSEYGARPFDTPDAGNTAQDDITWPPETSKGQGSGFRVVTPKPAQRRREHRQKSDPQVIQLQIRMGDPEWLTSTLLDASEGGIGVSISTPLTVGLTIAARGILDESRTERVSFATVKWCAETMNGSFQAGLEFGDQYSSSDNASQWLSAKTHEEFDYYEILQVSPNAESGTIERVYRLLAQRYHPHKRNTGDLEMFLKLHEAHMVLSDPELRAEYDARHRESKSFPGKVADRMRIAAQSGTNSFASNVPRWK
jgi:hypothetical protein